MSDRRAAMLGIAANLLFWPSLFVFAALRPDYAHETKSVSELGAWGAPNIWGFNVLGFILPGLMLAACGWLVGRVADSTWVAALLALAGACVALAGVFPADMNDYGSLTTIGHIVGSMGSLVAWALAMIFAALFTRKSWPALAALSAAALALMIGAFFLYETLPPGLVQRLTFAIFFGYFAAAALLMRRQATIGA